MLSITARGRRNAVRVAAALLLLLPIFQAALGAEISTSAADDPCLSGIPPPLDEAGKNDRYFDADNPALVRPELRRWLELGKWPAAYRLWRQSRLCPGGNAAVCGVEGPPSAAAECRDSAAAYDFLVMHRYLLQSLRSPAPMAPDPFALWSRFPRRENYPAALQSQLHAWPEGLLRAADTADAVRRLTPEQMRARWVSEAEFAQWLQCGNGIDALYPALMTNALPPTGGDEADPLDFYLFWQAHGWLDRVWEKYRRALGKTAADPELQAALIRQCRVLNFWIKQSAAAGDVPAVAPGAAPLYRAGELNSAYTGKYARVLGEVLEIRRGPHGMPFVLVDVRRVGVKPVWVGGLATSTERALRVGEPYWFIGTVRTTASVDASGGLQEFLQRPVLLLAAAVQTPR